MEKWMNRMMNIAVVVLSLSGLIACSEMDALSDPRMGRVTFNGSLNTCGSLDSKYLVDPISPTLQSMAELPVDMSVLSIASLLKPYGFDGSCSAFLGMGGSETATIKFKLDITKKITEMDLAITFHELSKIYHFDSKYALSRRIVNPSVSGAGMIENTLYVEFEYEKHIITIDLERINTSLDIWRGTIIIVDKALSVENPANYYSIGSFDISLDHSTGL